MSYSRKDFAPGAPNSKVARFTTGKASNDYDYNVRLISEGRVQIRSNALESARVAANKKLATLGEENYLLTVKTYPHIILRENKLIATAGADRLQEGMRKAFGKPTGRAARVENGQSIIIIYVPEDGIETAKKACEVAGTKLPMKTRIIVEEPVAPQLPPGA